MMAFEHKISGGAEKIANFVLAKLTIQKCIRKALLNCVVAATITKVSVPARCSGGETQLCMKNGSVT